MSDDPNPATVIVGIFLLIAGTCLILLGGGCTINVLIELGSSHRSELDFSGLALGISFVMLVVGALMIWGGVRLLKPRGE